MKKKIKFRKKIKMKFELDKLIIYVIFKLILFVYLYYIKTKKFKNINFFIIFNFFYFVW